MNAKREKGGGGDKPDAKTEGELSAYERWELPNLVGNQANDAVTNSYGTVSTKEVKPLTAEDLEAIRKEAYQDGLKQGHAEGLALGMEEGRTKGHEVGKQEGIAAGRQQIDSELAAHKRSLQQLSTSLLHPIEEQKEQIEQVLLNTTLALTRAVIHTEVQQNSAVIQAALKNSFAQLPNHAKGVKVILNPEDYALVAELIAQTDPDAQVEANAAIVRGGCLVETSTQVLDHTIEKRFQKVVQSMLLQAAQSSDFKAHQETPSTLENHSDYPVETLNEGLNEGQNEVDQENTDD